MGKRQMRCIFSLVVQQRAAQLAHAVVDARLKLHKGVNAEMAGMRSGTGGWGTCLFNAISNCFSSRHTRESSWPSICSSLAALGTLPVFNFNTTARNWRNSCAISSPPFREEPDTRLTRPHRPMSSELVAWAWEEGDAVAF